VYKGLISKLWRCQKERFSSQQLFPGARAFRHGVRLTIQFQDAATILRVHHCPSSNSSQTSSRPQNVFLKAHFPQYSFFTAPPSPQPPQLCLAWTSHGQGLIRRAVKHSMFPALDQGYYLPSPGTSLSHSFTSNLFRSLSFFPPQDKEH